AAEGADGRVKRQAIATRARGERQRHPVTQPRALHLAREGERGGQEDEQRDDGERRRDRGAGGNRERGNATTTTAAPALIGRRAQGTTAAAARMTWTISRVNC